MRLSKTANERLRKFYCFDVICRQVTLPETIDDAEIFLGVERERHQVLSLVSPPLVEVLVREAVELCLVRLATLVLLQSLHWF